MASIEHQECPTQCPMCENVPVVALKVGRSKRGAQLAQVSVLAQRGFDLDPSIGVWLRERRMTSAKTLVKSA
jgi:hypothetical protein